MRVSTAKIAFTMLNSTQIMNQVTPETFPASYSDIFLHVNWICFFFNANVNKIISDYEYVYYVKLCPYDSVCMQLLRVTHVYNVCVSWKQEATTCQQRKWPDNPCHVIPRATNIGQWILFTRPAVRNWWLGGLGAGKLDSADGFDVPKMITKWSWFIWMFQHTSGNRLDTLLIGMALRCKTSKSEGPRKWTNLQTTVFIGLKDVATKKLQKQKWRSSQRS